MYVERLWQKNHDGIIAEEFYDVILEVASYARKHLEIAQSYNGKVPKGTHLAFLLSYEAKQYLDDLEKYNFNIFDEHFRKKSFFRVPWSMYKGSKSGRF